ncbi:hypothetical protein KIW84_050473 [Lathyrus oleraceus]|uniref:Transposase-associated domain-containing protein n=1 Tax=Pisum sativum TaxID=3888 RepID=A0A9D4WJU0_PEA|nr:hypothetical protein KIW84_050473 [Pisum sativum]
MDNTWMSSNRLSREYENGVSEFVKFVVAHAEDPSRMICPCLGCCYGKRVDAVQLTSHLMRHGIDRNTYDCDRVEEIAEALEGDLTDCPEMFERLVSDAEKPLYDGCTKFTRLSAVLKLYNLKAGNGWSDKSFTELLALLKDMLPEDNVLPNQTYETKKMLCSIGMSYDKIHACPNDCVLFRNEYASLNECPKCGVSRYKNKLSPVKVLWYFPVIPRFRRMFRSETDSRHLTWHADERIIDGKY